jgi:large subunit ribosomal protein L10
LAITRARKEELVAEYHRQIDESTGFVMAEYNALSVPQMQDLRRQTRQAEGEVFVIKNRLFKLVLEERGLAVPEDLMTGPMIVGFSHKDVPSLTKLFRNAARGFEADRLMVRGGLLEGRIFGQDEVVAVSNLPTREELLSMVLRTINAPATQTAGVVASGIRQVLNVVKAYADKLEEAGGASAETAGAAA